MNSAPLLELRDIHDVPPPGFWPPAPGWWIIALLVLLALIALSRRLLRRYSRWRRQRVALVMLANIYQAFAQDKDASRFAAEVSMLILY
jgi:type II secretory pathway component PulF